MYTFLVLLLDEDDDMTRFCFSKLRHLSLYPFIIIIISKITISFFLKLASRLIFFVLRLLSLYLLLSLLLKTFLTSSIPTCKESYWLIIK